MLSNLGRILSQRHFGRKTFSRTIFLKRECLPLDIIPMLCLETQQRIL
ncbi:hypothetical protein LARI1_G008559 [Lachnellula arida]|uniref:Uncharacterized protein n=1 Tax=Lachnellula arida TaxID=1316785 RepID=A0A8T9AZH1_9HELO|nr:hypothetical protein LARI1_G008559 [Lachnellula arida]